MYSDNNQNSHTVLTWKQVCIFIIPLWVITILLSLRIFMDLYQRKIQELSKDIKYIRQDIYQINKKILGRNMKLEDITKSLMEIWLKYRDDSEESIKDINQLNKDLAKTLVYYCQISDLVAKAEANHFKAKQIIKNLLEGKFFIEEKEDLFKEYEDQGGPKPTDSFIKAKAENRAKDYRKQLIKTHEDLQYASRFWESTKEMIQFFKKTLEIQREEFNRSNEL